MEDNYRRDSFSHRVCDDLSEVILQYLPLKDKLRLECVSKQFQRTIFVKHYELITVYDGFNVKKFESMVKKLPNIKSISFPGDPFICGITAFNYNSVIKLIIKYCNHLTEVKSIEFNSISKQTINKFIEKFGPKMTLIFGRYDEIPENHSILQSFKSLFINNLDFDFEDLSQMNATNIEELSIDVKPEDMDVFHTLALNKTLTHLNVLLSGFDGHHNELKTYLKQISELKHLIDLKIYSDFGINDKSLAKELNAIAVNCLKLKSLNLVFYVNSKKSDINNLLSPLKAFKQLKRLDLIILNINVKDFTFKVFKGFESITHLGLTLYSTIEGSNNLPPFDPTILKEIETMLPKLQRLKILNEFTSEEGIQQILSPMKKLKSNIKVVSTQ